MAARGSSTLLLWLVGLALVGGGAWMMGRTPWSAPDDALIVYCAHDSEFSEPILQEFTRQTGIQVLPKFDTEATKSLGLVQLLQREKSEPRCDVFWNNEPLGMMDLARGGILQKYTSPNAERIPAPFKDPDNRWTGFAARFRVHIIAPKENMHDVSKETAEEFVADSWNNRPRTVAMAKPLYGTTLLHYTILWKVRGADGQQTWHHDIHKQGINEVNGNGAVKNLVASNACMTGWTDTDDCFNALQEHPTIRMLPVRIQGRTVCIPNAVGIVQGTPRLAAAQRLVDFLLSEETELELAHSAAGQVPLGPVDLDELPPRVREIQPWVAEGFDLRDLLPARDECLKFLEWEYLR